MCFTNSAAESGKKHCILTSTFESDRKLAKMHATGLKKIITQTHPQNKNRPLLPINNLRVATIFIYA